MNTTVNTIAERLKQARTSRGWSQAQLAVASDVSQGTIGNIESGARKSKGSLPQIAEALGVSHKWLADGVGDMHLSALVVAEPLAEYKVRGELSLSDNTDYPTIRRARVTLSAGATGFAVDYAPDDTDDAAPLVFPRAWYERRGLVPSKLVAVRVANGSMEPGLWHNDTVVINTADAEPRDGEVYACSYEGELVIKRLVRDVGQWWLCSDNPDKTRYPRKACHPGVQILGRIVHKQSDRI